MDERITIDGQAVYVDGKHVVDLWMDRHLGDQPTYPSVYSDSLRIEIEREQEVLMYEATSGTGVYTAGFALRWIALENRRHARYPMTDDDGTAVWAARLNLARAEQAEGEAAEYQEQMISALEEVAAERDRLREALLACDRSLGRVMDGSSLAQLRGVVTAALEKPHTRE
jgi:hypothetical protein